MAVLSVAIAPAILSSARMFRHRAGRRAASGRIVVTVKSASTSPSTSADQK